MQVPSSPLPLSGPVAQRLSITASIGGEDGLLSTVLPQDLLVDVLADRLMVGQLSIELNSNRALSVAVPSIWIELTTMLNLCESVAYFRNNLKNYVFIKLLFQLKCSGARTLISTLTRPWLLEMINHSVSMHFLAQVPEDLSTIICH